MPVIKKLFFIIILTVVIGSMSFMAGCGGSTSTATTKASSESEVQETTAASKVEGGEIYINKDLSIFCPDMWDALDVPGGVQIYTSTSTVLVTFLESTVTEAEDKAALEGESKQNSGTPLEEVTIAGIKLFKTSFTASDSSEQSLYSGISNGKQLKIKTISKNSKNNDLIKSVVESLILK
ncbi:MAG: hypothetical protein WCJ54_06280 [Actinomycetota bacterium]